MITTDGLPPNHWVRSQEEWIKGSNVIVNHSTSCGWIIGDEKVLFKGAGQTKGAKVLSVLERDFQALIMSTQCEWSRGLR